MTLIVLLLVLLVERVGLNSNSWQADRYVGWYTNKYANKVKDDDSLSLLFFILIPAIVVGVVLFVLDSRLLDFIVSLLVLGVCIGHYPIRNLYRQYLNAKERNDEEAMAILHQNLSNKNSPDDVNDTIGETLLWANFKFYAAPIFYYVVLGVPGVIFYTTLLFVTDEEKMEDHTSKLKTWQEWAFFVPARLVSLGFMFVGHFGSGLDAWLRLAGAVERPSREVLTEVAMAAEGQTKANDDSEQNPEQNLDRIHNAELMVRLAKRNMVLFLVVVALLTLYGQIV